MLAESTIKVGVGAIVFRGDEILIIKRGKAPLFGQWSIPGGGLEYGEEFEDAVRREVREETSIEIKDLSFFKVFNMVGENPQGYPERHIVMIDYVADWAAGAPRAGDDAAEAAFVSLETALSRVEWDLTRNAIKHAWRDRQARRPRP